MIKSTVLLVEDDPIQAEATKEILQNVGYDVICAYDGISAIKLAKTSNPDIILLDVILPGLDGYDVCRWLKTEESTRGIPVIMLTVKRDLLDKISGLNIGADDYLQKPYNELELNARIYASLRTKALQNELMMKNKQLEELLYKVEFMAITDVLSGLYNRRRFQDVLLKEFERSKRYATPFSIMLLDIDAFKNVNDTYGHMMGDIVIKEISRIIKTSIREVDTAFRYGGEEFTVALPNTKKEDAVHVGERIRKATEKHIFSDLKDQRITISIGISGMPDKEIDSGDKLIQCADVALYKAKQNGRNRVEVFEGEILTDT